MIDTHLFEMPCRELVEPHQRLFRGRFGRLLEPHPADCDACRAYLEQYRHTIRVLGRSPEQLLSQEARHALLGAFRGWSRR